MNDVQAFAKSLLKKSKPVTSDNVMGDIEQTYLLSRDNLKNVMEEFKKELEKKEKRCQASFVTCGTPRQQRRSRDQNETSLQEQQSERWDGVCDGSLSAVAGCGCPILLSGFLSDYQARTNMLIAYFKPSEVGPLSAPNTVKRSGQIGTLGLNGPNVRSAQVFHLVQTLSALGIFHASISSSSLISGYFGANLLFDHRTRDCTILSDASVDWINLMMLSCLFADYVSANKNFENVDNVKTSRRQASCTHMQSLRHE